MPNIPQINIGGTVYKVKDAELREHVVENGSSQPSNVNNRLWVKPSTNETQVPTWDEFSELGNEGLALIGSYTYRDNNHLITLPTNTKYKILIKVTNLSDSEGYMGVEYYVNNTSQWEDKPLVSANGTVKIDLPVAGNESDLIQINTKNSNSKTVRYNIYLNMASLIDGNTSNIVSLQNVINQSNRSLFMEFPLNQAGKQTFYYDAHFDHYGLTTAGTYATYQKYRVSCEEHIKFDRDITVSVASDFRWGYIPFINGSAGSWSGWKTSDFTLPANTEFVVQIARVSENTSEIADVITFVKQLTFTEGNSVIDTNKNVDFNKQNIKRISLNGQCFFYPDQFAIGRLTGGVFDNSSGYWACNTRISTPQKLVFDYDVLIESIDSDYQIGLFVFSSDESTYTDTGWLTKYVVPAGVKVMISSRNKNEENASQYYVNGYDGIISRLKKFTYLTKAMSSGEAAYPDLKTGQIFSMRKQRFKIVETGVYPPSVSGTTATQGFAYYGGVVFQCYSDNAIALVDFESGETISQLSANIGHGNSMCFTNAFYDREDEFPLALISDSLSSDGKIYIVRISRNSATITGTITIPVAQGGYYCNGVYDPLNNVLYCSGYTENSYTSETNNSILISRWKLDNLNQAPVFVDSFEIPFEPYTQQISYFNGFVFIVSSYYQTTPTKIIVIDPWKKAVTSVFAPPSPLNSRELEGIYFYDDGEEYVMMCHTNFGIDQYFLLKSNV